MTPRRTVLYAEDEAPLRGLVEYWLADAGYRVLLAADGAEALEAVRAERPDLVITDAMMPNLSGDELVEIMKADPELRDIPIVMATAAASPFRVERMLARGCHAVLGKPLEEATFLAAAAAALAAVADGSAEA
ncbi:MAG TPA: response regulator [Acidimicrobiales bacterium]|nr:response regulator [Acidimicrobiales bacterium]